MLELLIVLRLCLVLSYLMLCLRCRRVWVVVVIVLLLLLLLFEVVVMMSMMAVQLYWRTNEWWRQTLDEDWQRIGWRRGVVATRLNGGDGSPCWWVDVYRWRVFHEKDRDVSSCQTSNDESGTSDIASLAWCTIPFHRRQCPPITASRESAIHYPSPAHVIHHTQMNGAWGTTARVLKYL